MSRRGRLAGLALLFIACAIYGSFVPLRWRPIAWMDGLHRFARMPVVPTLHPFNGDFFTNVLVFLPIGFFAAGALSPRLGAEAQDDGRPGGLRYRRPRMSFKSALGVVGGVLVGSAALSTLVELGQVYVRARTPSWSDVVAQTLGGCAGAVLWVLVGVAAIDWLASALRAPSREDRVLRMLAIYVAGWAVCGFVPIAFPHLAHPDLYLWRVPQNVSRLALAGPVVIAALAAVPVGGLAALLAARSPFGWAAGLTAATGVGVLVVAERVRQVSFVPTDGHLAAALLGYSCGWLVASLARTRMSRWTLGQTLWWPLVALAGWVALVVLQYWAPFDFGVGAQALGQRVAVLYTRAPFHRYYWLPPLVALSEVLTLLLLALGTSFLVSFVRPRTRPLLPARLAVLLTALFFTLVEWGQLYLRWRRADPTDVLIAAAGAFMGTVVARALVGPPAPVNRDVSP